MSHLIDETLLNLIAFKNNNELILDQLNARIIEAEKIIFKETCHKKYLDRCEPEFCTERITNSCKYFSELSRLQALLK
jgi:hypothetical protein